MRWYFHRSKTLRHDLKGAWRSRILLQLHRVLVGDHPVDFSIWGRKLRFQSSGNVMASHGYYVGEIEYHVSKFLVGRLEADFVMIDVGAHHGVHSLVVAHELDQRRLAGHVHAFEPDSRNYERLLFNVRQNHLEGRITAHNVAVSEREGERSFLCCWEDNSSNTLAENQSYALDGLSASLLNVKSITLDSLIASIPRVHVIKIDVQGAEPVVLNGAQKLIQRDRPVLVVEAVPGWPTTRETAECLRALAYDVFGLTAAGQLCAIDSPEMFVSWDWVGIPSEATLRWSRNLA